jgi:hypothetical protein
MAVSRRQACAAEDLASVIRWMPGLERTELEGCVVSTVPGDDARLAKISGVRLAPSAVREALEQTRALLRAQGRTSSTWWLGPSSTPPDLAQRLLALGLRPGPPTTAMAIDRAPGGERARGIEVRQASGPGDAHAVAAILAEAFGFDDAARDAVERAVLEGLTSPHATHSIADFLALVDGRPVATAASVYVDDAVGLIGGSTRPAFRGRGAYAALVRARFDDAVAHGSGALVTQADDRTSAPILRRLGFEALFPLTLLVDSFGG